MEIKDDAYLVGNTVNGLWKCDWYWDMKNMWIKLGTMARRVPGYSGAAGNILCLLATHWGGVGVPCLLWCPVLYCYTAEVKECGDITQRVSCAVYDMMMAGETIDWCIPIRVSGALN